MVTKHFIEQWRNRMMGRNIPKTLLKELMVKCFKMVELNNNEDELVVVENFNNPRRLLHGFFDFFSSINGNSRSP